MSRKHFIKMAARISAETDRARAQAMFDFAVEVCLDANSRFDVSRFHTACGLDLRAPALGLVCGV